MEHTARLAQETLPARPAHQAEMAVRREHRREHHAEHLEQQAETGDKAVPAEQPEEVVSAAAHSVKREQRMTS